MIDTNAIPELSDAATAAKSAFDAWMLVAGAAGIAVTHLYHTVVNGGGLKNIARKFWDSTTPNPDRKDTVRLEYLQRLFPADDVRFLIDTNQRDRLKVMLDEHIFPAKSPNPTFNDSTK